MKNAITIVIEHAMPIIIVIEQIKLEDRRQSKPNATAMEQVYLTSYKVQIPFMKLLLLLKSESKSLFDLILS